MEANVVEEDRLSSGAMSSTESADEMVETLIQGRAKRATAGRHMSALLNAEADDDLALLFEEVEDDNEFAVADEAGDQEDDERLESSSEDEDDATAQNDELEGERELQAQEKAERKKRRAADPLSFPALKKKKVKINPTAVTPATAPRPKKKSERLSWLPTPDEGPTRSSSRRQTMQNKELTHARLKDSERKRRKLLANMEKAAKRKALLKPKEMTQAEHLAEAERVERLNSKSLNRWEEAERKKAEERLAKIEALQNRRLHGPVISYWSGIATWVDGVLKRVGKVDITPKPDKEESAKRKSKKGDREESTALEQKSAVTASSGHPSLSISVPAAPTPLPENAASTDRDVQMTDHTTEQPDGDLSVAGTGAGDKPQKDTSLQPHAGETASGTSKPPDQVGDSSGTAGGPEAMNSAGSNVEPATESANAANKTPSPTGESVASQTKDETPTASQVKKPVRPDLASNHGPSANDAGAMTAMSTTSKSSSPGIKRSPSFSIVVPPPSRDREKTKGSRQEHIHGDEVDPSAVAARKGGSDISPSPAAVTQSGSPNGFHVEIPARTSQSSLTSSHVPANAPHTGDHPGETAVETPRGHADGATTQPDGSTGPPKVEKTGRNLTILENFDEKTAQSREFNIYFNAKKPPRLTSAYFFSLSRHPLITS